MKKIFLVLAILFSFIFIFSLTYGSKITRRIQKKRSKNTFLKVLDKDKFLKVVNDKTIWIDDQLKDDFKSFEKTKISLNAISNTFDEIQKNRKKDKTNFIRFRIIDNDLYMYVAENKKFPKRQFTFEKALRTLIKTIKMPNVDIIYSDEDGTPLFFNPKEFYVNKTTKVQGPLLSRAKLKNLDYVILIPDYHDLSSKNKSTIANMENLNEKYPWDKKIEKAFWRGVNRRKSRYLLAQESYKMPSFLDAGFPFNIDEPNEELENPYISVDHLGKNFASIDEHMQYKYLPCLDGFFCTYPGYQWRLLSNSVCLKQESDEIQWFYKALKPYIHYVPIKNDMTDVIEKIKWAIKNDEKCREIAIKASLFAKESLTFENAYGFLYKVLKEYEKKQSFTKKDLIKDMKNSKKWVCINDRKKANKRLKKRGFDIH